MSVGGDRLRELLRRAGLGGLDPRVAACLAAGAVLALAWCAWTWLGEAGAGGVPEDLPSDPGISAEASGTAEVRRAVVHVVGAVLRPGVYELPSGARVRDAVAAAGGLLGSAAPDGLNLARLVQDGEQLRVPTQEEASAAVAPGGGGGVGSAAGGKVDLNTADEAALDTLPGIGPSTAAKIVRDREANGPFRKVEDLLRVPGIGEKRLDELRDLVSVG